MAIDAPGRSDPGAEVRIFHPLYQIIDLIPYARPK